jgi:hypothetical protein
MLVCWKEGLVPATSSRPGPMKGRSAVVDRSKSGKRFRPQKPVEPRSSVTSKSGIETKPHKSRKSRTPSKTKSPPRKPPPSGPTWIYVILVGIATGIITWLVIAYAPSVPFAAYLGIIAALLVIIALQHEGHIPNKADTARKKSEWTMFQ